ncbi:MAG: glutathione S-transferase family protein [Burkholderiales bacterium]|nr:glutathione S-transferase family protein [Burkholderiales bacterium]
MSAAPSASVPRDPGLPFAIGERPVLVSHALCPYVQRAVIVLAEKGVDWQRVDIDLSNKPAWFTALSPTGQTPMLLLREGDAVLPLFESAVICDYLDETRAPALHPAAPLARARHRAWGEFASAMLNGIWQLYTAREEAGFLAARDTLRQRCERLESELARRAGGPWFGGAAFSVVDAAFGPVWRYFEVIDPIADTTLCERLPQLQQWRAALAQRPSVRQAVAPDYPGRLREFFARQGGWLGQRVAAAALG